MITLLKRKLHEYNLMNLHHKVMEGTATEQDLVTYERMADLYDLYYGEEENVA